MTTAEERAAEREEAERQLRNALATCHLDGPFAFPQAFDPLTAVFGAGGIRDKFAVCLLCGAMVVLNDPEERTDGPPVERGVQLHVAWHAEAAR